MSNGKTILVTVSVLDPMPENEADVDREIRIERMKRELEELSGGAMISGLIVGTKRYRGRNDSCIRRDIAAIKMREHENALVGSPRRALARKAAQK